MAIPPVPSDFKPKSFWQRPEGTFGMVVLALAGVMGLWGLTFALPFIVWLLANTIYAILLCLGVSLLAMFVTSRRLWTLVQFGFKSAMRALTGVFVEIDPIGILKNYISDVEKDLEGMDSQIQNLAGQMQQLAEEIRTNERGINDAVKLAGKAKEQKKGAALYLQARQAGRLKDSNLTLQGLYEKMEFLYRFLTKTRETSGLLVEDMKAEVHEQERRRAMIRTSVSAIASARRIIKGDPDKRELFDQAMEYLANDYGQKIGEIRDFIETSGSVIDKMDLAQGVAIDDALAMIEDLERRGNTLLVDDTTRLDLLDKSRDRAQVLDFSPAREPVRIVK